MISRGRPRAVLRYVRRPGRWDDDCRPPRAPGGVSGDTHERALDRSEQIEGGGRIITCASRIPNSLAESRLEATLRGA